MPSPFFKEIQPNHTPGPWTTVPLYRNGALVALRIKAEAVTVAVLPNEAPDSDEEARTALRGDASLISAAPELLELARRVAEHFEYTDAPLGEAARAIIAKAEGR